MQSSADFRMRALKQFVLLAAVLLGVSACGGGGGSGGSGGSTSNVTISGKITFDRVPFKATPGTGLNFNGIIESAARNVVVEAVQPGNVLGGETVVASTTTDVAGDYTMQVPANTTVFIRAKAQMLKTGTAPTWNFKVLNNTSSDALYVMDGTAASSGSVSSTRNLRATSGWGGTTYTGTRAAAPFAILDTMYHVKSLILSAKADTAFPALDLFWSVNNRPASPFCPDAGNVVSSLYTTFSASNPNDECSTPTAGRDGIYILGDYSQNDTDEFDQHVIAHEAGHYFEDRFSRSDSIGGEHAINSKLDLRVAFGEGWGDAFGAMALNDPVYRDSTGANADGGFNLESSTPSAPGWFSEFSTFKILWDLFDGANEPNDTVALGFTPIYNVMTGAQSSTDALTGIFPFARALKASNAAAVTGINALLAEHSIVSNVDDFGSSETNAGGSADALPIYTDIQPNGGTRQVCGNADTVIGFYNKLGNRRLLRLVLTQQTTITVTATGPAGTPAPDPDVYLWKRGQLLAIADAVGVQEILPMAGQPPLSLAAGTYVIEVFEYSHTDAAEPQRGRTCINVSLTG
ncbi:MAG: hypothetical protein ABL964_01225 [Steroidobacteraceae bacterium]